MKINHLLTAAVALASAGTAQATALTTTDEVLTVVDFTNQSSYSLDLGVTAISLVSSPVLSVTAADTNFQTFMNLTSTGDDVEWRVEGNNITTVSGKEYDNLISTFTTSVASDFQANALYLNATNGITHLATTVATINAEQGYYSFYPGSLTSSAYNTLATLSFDPGVWGTNAQGTEGDLINSAALGASLNLWSIARTDATTITPTNLTTANFTVTGSGTNAVGQLTIGQQATGSITSAPLPTSVWLFLSGITALLSLKRRKNSL
jgi:hypothetical protein